MLLVILNDQKMLKQLRDNFAVFVNFNANRRGGPYFKHTNTSFDDGLVNI